MIKIQYIGDISPTRVKVKEILLRLKKDDVFDLEEKYAELLLRNPNFKVVSKEVNKKELKEEEKEIDFDLNNDGIVDSKDTSIAGKVLANARIKNKD